MRVARGLAVATIPFVDKCKHGLGGRASDIFLPDKPRK